MSGTPRQHLTFGSRQGALDEAVGRLTEGLPLSFKLRDSSYLGEYYLARPAAPYAASLKLHANRDPVDGQPIRRDAPDQGLILEAEDVADAKALTGLLAQMGFLPLTGNG